MRMPEKVEVVVLEPAVPDSDRLRDVVVEQAVLARPD